MLDLSSFNWVQLIKKSDLPSNAKLIGFYLATFMNAEHNIAWPSQRRISSETGLTEPTVRKYLSVLESEDWLLVRKKAHHVDTGVQHYLHNEYLINVPQRVISLLSDQSRGKTGDEQRVNSSRAEGKELTPNNNKNNNINNNLSREDQKKSTKPKTLPAWSDDQGFEDLGLKLGITPRPGEAWNGFKNRVKYAVGE